MITSQACDYNLFVPPLETGLLCHVKLSDWSGTKIITLEMTPTDTIKRIKDKIHDLEGIPLKDYKIWYEGRLLDDEHTLSACNLETISSLHLTPKPEG